MLSMHKGPVCHPLPGAGAGRYKLPSMYFRYSVKAEWSTINYFSSRYGEIPTLSGL